MAKRTLEDMENDLKRIKLEKRLYLKKQREEERKKELRS